MGWFRSGWNNKKWGMCMKLSSGDNDREWNGFVSEMV